MDWDLDPEQKELLAFANRVIALRHDHPVFRRRRFYKGLAKRGGESDLGEIEWFNSSGHHMTEEEWDQAWARSTMIFLNGLAINEPDERGREIIDDDFILCFNASPEDIDFTLPKQTYGKTWSTVLNTADDLDESKHDASAKVNVTARSILILRSPRGNEDE